MSENQRSGIRIPVVLPVEVHWKSRGGRTRRVAGKTENISGNGLFTCIPIRPPCNTTVTVRVPCLRTSPLSPSNCSATAGSSDGIVPAKQGEWERRLTSTNSGPLALKPLDAV